MSLTVAWVLLTTVTLGYPQERAPSRPLTPPPSEAAFIAMDAEGKRRVLGEIATFRSSAAVDEVIAFVRIGMNDPAPRVRAMAMSAVAGRAMVSHTVGAYKDAPHRASTPYARFPLEWESDRAVLRSALLADCTDRLWNDQDRSVREMAFLAVGYLATSPAGPSIDEASAPLFINVVRKHPDESVRARSVQALALSSISAPEVRALIVDALVDASALVRRNAQTALQPTILGRSRSLTYGESRDVLVNALRSPDAGVRLGAVQALNLFGTVAREQLLLLKRMRARDPDEAVRFSADLAVASVEGRPKGAVIVK